MLPLKIYYVTFDGDKIQRISKYVHLGNIVGGCNNEIRIKITTDDCIRRANTVMSQFKLAHHSIKCKLLNRSVLLCMGFYSGMYQQSRSIRFIFLGENACENCITL